MDEPFDACKWQRTKPLEADNTELSLPYVHHLCKKLNHQTAEIYRHPYDPNSWVQRAITLYRLRYPELSVGDAHKATLLCQTHLTQLSVAEGRSLGYRMGFSMHDESSQSQERTELIKEHLRSLLERAQKLVNDSTEPCQDDREGLYLRRPYPWMKDHHLVRSDELLEAINREFDCNSSSEAVEASCLIQRHAFGKIDGGRNTSEILGVFAKRDVMKGEVIVMDRSKIWGWIGTSSEDDDVSSSGVDVCEESIYHNSCSSSNDNDPSSNGVDGREKSVHHDNGSNYASRDTRDLRWIKDRSGKLATNVMRNAKLLQGCVDDNFDHPLDHPLIARMTPNYPKDGMEIFSLAHDIAILNDALVQVGIDIFANPNFDTWVLFMVEARTFNNGCATPTMGLIGPLFTLFNHSCEPNVEWRILKDSQSISLKASTDVKKGEQLFVMYDEFIEEKPLCDRRRRLWKWLDSPCQCKRCIREEASADEPVFDQAWDTEEKPVFPEDTVKLRN